MGDMRQALLGSLAEQRFVRDNFVECLANRTGAYRVRWWPDGTLAKVETRVTKSRLSHHWRTIYNGAGEPSLAAKCATRSALRALRDGNGPAPLVALFAAPTKDPSHAD